MNVIDQNSIKYMPGPIHFFMNVITGITFSIGLFFFLNGIRLENDVQDQKKAGLFLFAMALLVYITNRASMMEVEVSSIGVRRVRRFFGKLEVVEIPFSDIAETEILPLSRNLQITSKSGKLLSIKRGIVERPENLDEIDLPFAERHKRILLRLQERIEAGIQVEKQRAGNK